MTSSLVRIRWEIHAPIHETRPRDNPASQNGTCVRADMTAATRITPAMMSAGANREDLGGASLSARIKSRCSSVSGGTWFMANAWLRMKISSTTSRCGTGYRQRHSATRLKVVIKRVISTRGG